MGSQSELRKVTSYEGEINNQDRSNLLIFENPTDVISVIQGTISKLVYLRNQAVRDMKKEELCETLLARLKFQEDCDTILPKILRKEM